MKQQVRIIGGQYRGKKINFPDIEGLRPTSDRIRETLFNWLMHSIRGARCLDAFAGSGALGFEALSRGAQRVVLVEQQEPVLKNLQKSALLFKAENLTVVKADALQFLASTKEQFDLVFLDPPFAKPCYEECLNILAQTDRLIPGGLVYVESPSPMQLDPVIWQEKKAKRAGNVYYALFEKHHPANARDDIRE